MPPASVSSLNKKTTLQVSRYDRAASWVISLLILLGVVAFFLLMAWLTSKLFVNPKAAPVELADIGEGEGPSGGSPDLGAPEEVEIPQEDIEETISAVAEVVVEQADQIENPDRRPSGRGGGGFGTGYGPGRGGGVHRHWEVLFARGSTLSVYARQLDFFGIELGVLLPGNRVQYVSKLAQSRPVVRISTDSPDKEKRYYLTWRSGQLRKADLELLLKAGIDASDRIILQFLPPAVEAQLAGMEKARAGPKAKRIEKTVFGVKSAGDGYEFYIVEQVVQP